MLSAFHKSSRMFYLILHVLQSLWMVAESHCSFMCLAVELLRKYQLSEMCLIFLFCGTGLDMSLVFPMSISVCFSYLFVLGCIPFCGFEQLHG
jgi:hypothetical protein